MEPITAQPPAAVFDGDSGAAPPITPLRAAPRRWLVLMLSLAIVAQWVAYRRSFQKLPAVDVFPEIIEVHRGDAQGITAFFTHSVSNKAYRPLDSLLIWFFGHVSTTQPVWGIHLGELLFASSIAAVGALWVRQLRLSKAGAAVAIAMMCLHPVLVLSTASVDGIDSVGSTAILWLGAYLVLVARSRVAAVAWGLLCFCVGSLLKEYTFALLPISVCVAVCLRARTDPFWKDRAAWRDAIALSAVMLVAFFVLMIVRSKTMEASGAQRGLSYIAVTPESWLLNAMIFSAGLLFIANSVWAFVNQDSLGVLILAGIWSMAITLTIAGGLWLRWTRGPTRAPQPLADDEPAVPIVGLPRWLLFLPLVLCAATCPALIMTHVSEMYVPPLLIPFALIAGLAADGFVAGPRLLRPLGLTIAAAALVLSLLAINDKVDRLVDIGRRADDQMRQLLAIVPPDAHGWKIAMLIGVSDRPEIPSYATMSADDDQLLSQGDALEWPRYGCGHIFDVYNLADPNYNPLHYDLVVFWDVTKQKLTVANRRRKAALPTTGASAYPPVSLAPHPSPDQLAGSIWWPPWGFAPRATIGVTFLAALAWFDWRRRGPDARRWREYVFLLACSAAAAVYAAANDQITSSVSWEYFYYGKELWQQLGPQTPPARGALSWGAAKVGAASGWWVGALLGAGLLIANNPRRDRAGREIPTLPLPRLFRFVAVPLAAAAVLSVFLGWAGYLGWLNPLGSDFQELWAMDMWHPRHFTACWGAHLGAYAGGLLGAIPAVIMVIHRRRAI